MKILRKTAGIILSFLLMTVLLPVSRAYADNVSAVLTFADTGITETQAGSGYSISGTSLIISTSGVYQLTGSCSEGTVEISKGVSDVVLILSDLNLTSAATAPVIIKKSASVTIHLDGINTLTNNEDPSSEETNTDFEGAAIKAKSGASVLFCGEGTLNVNGNAKNGIKGGAETSIVFGSGTYIVNALNNGIASDGSLVFHTGTYTVTSGNDAIKSVPEADDTASSGTVTVNGGTYTIRACGDGIQADTALTLNAGQFDLMTMAGWNDSSFDKDTMSCKGLKASGDREDTDHLLRVNGGTFVLNTADDAVHSDGDAQISAGVFSIQSGDDGIHADGTLTLGTEGGYDRDPDITVLNSYEGLEGANIYIYSGRYYTCASDDGINAAGGNDGSGGTDPWHGHPGHGGSSDYNIYVYGGNIYVNCTGDGLDSNGGLYLYGGKQTVLSQGQGGDNSPLDSDGTMIVKGAEVFAAGTNPMNDNPSSGSQSFYTWKTTYNAGTVISLKSASTLLCSEKLLRRTNYILYSSPDVTAQPSISSGGSVDPCRSNDWNHAWDSGVTVQEPSASSAGLIEYTCADCNKTEYRTVPYVPPWSCGGHDSGTVPEDPGYTVRFSPEQGLTIDVFYTQDYTSPDETDVTETVSRNSDTGLPDSTGNGQVNFAVRTSAGTEVGTVTVTGTYKNLKDVSTEDSPHTYRVTKVESDLLITVTAVSSSPDIPIQGIAVEPAEITLSVGETVQLTAVITPSDASDQTVTWSSDNEAASVDSSGLVTTAEEGTAVITAAAGAYSASCTVTVKDPVIDFVRRLYRLCLNREPDQGGLNNWVGQLRSGTKTAAQVVQGFFNSKEMKNLNLSGEEWIERCYLVMMDRASDTGGKANWVDKYESGVSSNYILKGFVDSSEFRKICEDFGVERGTITLTEARDQNIGITKFVSRCYSEVLGRRGDAGGLNNWCSKILSASDKKKAAINVATSSFFHSTEFRNRNTTNEEFVVICYRTFLGRDPDTGGYNSWLNKLNSGTSRDSVMMGFANSKEFTNIMAMYGIQ